MASGRQDINILGKSAAQMHTSQCEPILENLEEQSMEDVHSQFVVPI